MIATVLLLRQVIFADASGWHGSYHTPGHFPKIIVLGYIDKARVGQQAHDIIRQPRGTFKDDFPAVFQ